MKFEVFHRGLLGRPDVIAVDMIHYPGLWGLCFSHHPPHNNHPRYAADTTTAGVLRFLDESRNGREGLRLEALVDYTITTHHMDADALLPVWALLHPDAALARREQLERIARCGDFFIYLDDDCAKVNFSVEELHRQMRGIGPRGERVVDNELTRRCFAELLPQLQALLDDPGPYASLWEQPLRLMHADLDYLARPGRVTELWQQHTSVVESDHDLDTHALNTACANDLLLVWRTDSQQRRIDVRPAIAWYDLTSLPHRPRYGLDLLAARLNAAENGPDAPEVWQYHPGPVSISAASSRLPQETVVHIIAEWLDAESRERVSVLYRADVQEVFRQQCRHAIFTSHERFARAGAVRFMPGACYGGLYCLNQATAHGFEQQPEERPAVLPLSQGKSCLPFAVSDDFYWNRSTPQPLKLRVTYEDHARGIMYVEYDTWEDPCCSTPPVTLTGDGRTKTVTLALDNARLGNSLEDGADLRLLCLPADALRLRELDLQK